MAGKGQASSEERSRSRSLCTRCSSTPDGVQRRRGVALGSAICQPSCGRSQLLPEQAAMVWQSSRQFDRKKHWERWLQSTFFLLVPPICTDQMTWRLSKVSPARLTDWGAPIDRIARRGGRGKLQLRAMVGVVERAALETQHPSLRAATARRPFHQLCLRARRCRRQADKAVRAPPAGVPLAAWPVNGSRNHGAAAIEA